MAVCSGGCRKEGGMADPGSTSCSGESREREAGGSSKGEARESRTQVWEGSVGSSWRGCGEGVNWYGERSEFGAESGASTGGLTRMTLCPAAPAQSLTHLLARTHSHSPTCSPVPLLTWRGPPSAAPAVCAPVCSELAIRELPRPPQQRAGRSGHVALKVGQLM